MQFVLRIIDYIFKSLLVKLCLLAAKVRDPTGTDRLHYTDDLVILFYKHAFEVFQCRRIGILGESSFDGTFHFWPFQLSKKV